MLPPLNPQSMKNGLRNRSAIEFLGIWEQLNNPAFKPVLFDGFKKQAGLQMIEQAAAIRDNLILEALTAQQISFVCASEEN